MHDFKGWLKDSHQTFIENGKIVKGPLTFISNADFVIRFEELQDGFDESRRIIGLPPLVIENYNATEERKKSGAKSYREYYDDESIAIVEKLYKKIINRFSYEF